MSRYELSVVCQSAGRNVARPAGFEPAAFGSGGQRSIQLSYGRVTKGCLTRAKVRAGEGWRARQDSNLRPTDSKSGALSN